MSRTITIVLFTIFAAAMLFSGYILFKPSVNSQNTSSNSNKKTTTLESRDGCPPGQSRRLMPSMCMDDPQLTAAPSKKETSGCPDGTHVMGGGCMRMDGSMVGDSMMRGDEVMKMDMAAMVTSEQNFISGMIPHHQEAVDSSNSLLKTTQNPKLKMLMNSIVSGQTSEISQMKQWYKSWYGKDWTDDNTYMKMMRNSANMDQKMTEKRWLQDMIAHHQGAVDMAKKVLTISGIRPETKAFAQNIITDQAREIAQMQSWLDSDYR